MTNSKKQVRKNRRNKKGILILIVLLAIGFAAVTTTLYINGTIRIGANQKNFDDKLVFTSANISYDQKSSNVLQTTITPIGEDGVKTLEFSVGVFKNIGEYATVNYTIMNDSQYIAELEDIVCKVFDEEETDITDKVSQRKEYISLETSSFGANKELNPGSSTSGYLTVTMIKSYVGSTAVADEEKSEDTDTKTYTIKCTIKANAKSNSASSDNDDASGSASA
ncbi:MAG: hypothetical protein J1F35_02050 [Erysipelotrichales bacterium]|nr:hypothetical protein [Erysipelotrichales bacterium]